MRCGCRQSSSSSTPCDSVAASASGQVSAGACKDGVRIGVKGVHKCTALEKKKKSEKKKRKKKRKADLLVQTPTKTPTSTVSCMCMALVWMCREVRKGGIWNDGIERVG